MKKNFKFIIGFDVDLPAVEWNDQVTKKMEELGFNVVPPALYDETFIAIYTSK